MPDYQSDAVTGIVKSRLSHLKIRLEFGTHLHFWGV
jgi:hypothetical protein